MTSKVDLRKSYRGVIDKLTEVLSGRLTHEQHAHYTYLQQRAQEAENRRQKARRAHRTMARSSRKANRRG